jgi:hypothetical protein
MSCRVPRNVSYRIVPQKPSSILSSHCDPLGRLIDLKSIDLLQISTRGELQRPEVVEMVDSVVSGKHDEPIIVQDRDVVAPAYGDLAGNNLGLPFQGVYGQHARQWAVFDLLAEDQTYRDSKREHPEHTCVLCDSGTTRTNLATMSNHQSQSAFTNRRVRR